MWRPDGWKNPRPGTGEGLPTNDWCFSEYDLHNYFEQGADAMLNALRRAGWKPDGKSMREIISADGMVLDILFTGKERVEGIFVFIPEE